MKIDHLFRFTVKEKSTNIYSLSFSINPSFREIAIKNRLIAIRQYPTKSFEDDVYEILIDSIDFGILYFPSEVFGYGYVTDTNDLILCKRVRKRQSIEIVIFEDKKPYSYLFYQAYKSGQFRDALKEAKKRT